MRLKEEKLPTENDPKSLTHTINAQKSLRTMMRCSAVLLYMFIHHQMMHHLKLACTWKDNFVCRLNSSKKFHLSHKVWSLDTFVWPFLFCEALRRSCCHILAQFLIRLCAGMECVFSLWVYVSAFPPNCPLNSKSREKKDFLDHFNPTTMHAGKHQVLYDNNI